MADLVTSDKQAIYSGFPELISLVAYDAGFAALSTAGQVWTWGDERYLACLGRDVTEASPANKPRTVADLEGLPTGPVKKLVAGGYLLAAITEGNDLYVWGGHPGRTPLLADISGQPSPVVIEDNDIADVGIGDSHLIALTATGEVFTIGANQNGQLGLAAESSESWARVDLGLDQKQHLTRVAAGPKSSFIIVETNID